MHRWRKPPIFALAYISPARSSKRRISSILRRIARLVSAPGNAPTGATLPTAIQQSSDDERQAHEEGDDGGPLTGSGGPAEHHDQDRDRERGPDRDQRERVLGLPVVH